jgi:hypothetical protein
MLNHLECDKTEQLKRNRQGRMWDGATTFGRLTLYKMSFSRINGLYILIVTDSEF